MRHTIQRHAKREGFGGWRRLGSVLGIALSLSAQAEPGAIVFVAPTNDSMPLARFKGDEIEGGIIKDLGDAIAARMGLSPRYVSLPSARVSEGMNKGRADCLCYALPEWLTGSFYWSDPVIEDAEEIASRTDAPPITALEDLIDEPLGTVIAYHYQEVEAALGSHFRREDAKSMELNIRKIAAGRMRYAIVEKLPFDYALRRNPTDQIRVALVYAPFAARCAMSSHSAIPFAAFDAAVKSLIADGTVAQIIAAYR